MDNYLNKLANDQTNSDNHFVNFLNTYINTKEALIELIDALKSKLNLTHIDEYFEKMKSYFETYDIKRSDILTTSHVFCNCGIYTKAPLCDWVKKNPELFETDVSFFDNLFSFCDRSGININNDVSSYPIDKLYEKEILIDDQTEAEKLKLLNTIVVNYKYLLDDAAINC